MKDCIVPPKSIKLIGRLFVSNLLALFVNKYRYTVFCNGKPLNKYGFQPPCPPCHLFQPFD